MIQARSKPYVVASLGAICWLLGAASAFGYDRQAAVAYARKYWGPGQANYNAAFGEPPGNDCAHFVSQAFLAGNLRFDNASGIVDEHGTMIRANELGIELTANHGTQRVVDYGEVSDVPQNLQPGDPIFVMRFISGATLSYLLNRKTHAMLLTGQNPLRYSAHTDNYMDRPFTFIDDWFIENGDSWFRYFQLPGAPIVKYVLVYQMRGGVQKTIAEYKYDDDYRPEIKTGEYYKHTYNGLQPVTLTPGVAGAGEVRVKVIFDTTMNQASLSAAMGKTAPFEQFVFTTTGWSATHQLLDTWEGKLTIPDNLADVDGVHHITIDARAPDGSRVDADGNLSQYNPGPDTRISFSVATTPPQISVRSGQGVLEYGAITRDTRIRIAAQATSAPIKRVDVFRNGTLYLETTATAFSKDFEPSSWYYARACDTIENCIVTAFGIFGPDEDIPPAPPPPGAPPGGNQKMPPPPGSPPGTPPQPPEPPQPPYRQPQPPPSQPPCVTASLNPSTGKKGCLQTPPAPPPTDPAPKRCRRYQNGCPDPIYFTPHDPNQMFGPTGPVTPGQLMTYTIEFENEGQGTARGIYVTDTLHPALDETTLVLRDMYRVDFASNTQVAATFPWSFDPETRTVTVLCGDATYRHGGRFILELRLKSNAPAGTVINNQATVFFPNALEATPTNTIVSAVPLPTQLVYEGPASGMYADAARLAARLTAASNPVALQPVDFELAAVSTRATTDESGLAASAVLLSTSSGSYLLSARYPGDGFYFLPSEVSLQFAVNKRPTVLQEPYATARATDTVHLSLSLLDDRQKALDFQSEEPKTVILEILNDAGEATSLATGLLAGTTAQFTFQVPQPLQASWPIRARFAGDSRYSAAVANGILSLLDETAPTITVVSPSAGDAFFEGGVITASFSLSDDADPAPTASAYLLSADGQQSIVISTHEAVAVSSLSVGGWQMIVNAIDWVGNKTSTTTGVFTIGLGSPDMIAPLVRLDFPGTAAGVEQAVGGLVNVRGEVSDASALTWKLETAPGMGATSGFVQLAAGASNVAGTIFNWDTTSLVGYQTLRLSAVDSFGNEASVTAAVFIGNPVFTFAIGRKDSDYIVSTLKNPTGIAVRNDGLIWVASSQSDQLLLVTSTGAVLGQVGVGPQHGHQNDDLRFSGPQGLALDTAGSLYVADTNKNRVVKLSPDGSQLLLELGRENGRGRPRPGSASGELKHPWDVAVDSNGDIYVADAGNRRIQVFDAAGGFLREFGQSVLLSTSELRGLALTSEGLWVSDKELERIYLFSRSGALIKSIGDADSAVGEISRVRGLASDRLGALYVIEPNRDRAQKFDPEGKGMLAFGAREQASQADRHAKRYLTQPIDAAVAPDGSIWITDTGRDRIVRYALPAFGAYGVASASSGGGSFSSSNVEPARRVVDHKDGARVERDDGTGVRVPANALAADLELTVDKGDETKDSARKQEKRQSRRVQEVSEEIEYGPEGTTFAVPVTLILGYDAAKIASLGLKEDDLKVHYWNPITGDWDALPSTVDKQNKTVNAPTTHFSLYQVMAPGGTGVAAGGADASFVKRDIFVFPNPARAGAKPTIHVEVGIADKVTVRLFDTAGRELRKATFDQAPAVIDSGSGPRYAYEFVWDGHIASGVYYYVVEAEKAGAPPIRASGKLGVVR